MKFNDLLALNFRWRYCGEMVILVDRQRLVLPLSDVKELFGDREVLLFHDNMVYLK